MQPRYDVSDFETRVDRPRRVVLMRAGKPEICEKAVTHELGDKAVVARHHARTGVLIRPDDLPHILGIEPCRQRRRANKVREHEGQLAPLRGILGGRERRRAGDDDRATTPLSCRD